MPEYIVCMERTEVSRAEFRVTADSPQDARLAVTDAISGNGGTLEGSLDYIYERFDKGVESTEFIVCEVRDPENDYDGDRLIDDEVENA